MGKRIWFWIVMGLTAAALAASAVMLIDYVRPAPVFCGADGGCGIVKRTVFAYPLGIPMPIFGISGLLAVGLFACIAGKRARIAQAVLAIAGALVAAGLLVVQALLGTICPYCAVVDGSMLLVATVSVVRLKEGWDPPAGRTPAGGAVAGYLAAIVVPLTIGSMKSPLPPEVPAPIAEEIGKTPKGKITVVDFADFECPFCRATHAELAPLVAERKDKIRVARKHVPLRMHPHAMDAARAACCGEALGRGDEMADRLFTADKQDLTPEGCAKIAAELGIDAAKFKDCLAAPSTEERIKKDSEAFRASKGHGLPTIWVDTQKLEGAQDKETLRAAIDDAIRRL